MRFATASADIKKMKLTKKITISAMAIAISAAMLSLGALVEVLDMAVASLMSLLVVFVFIEIGSPFVWFVWLGTSIITGLIPNGLLVGLEYLAVFGLYPILKAYFEKAPRYLRWPIKIVYVNLFIAAAFILTELVSSISFFEIEKWYFKVALAVGLNLVFVLYDVYLTRMIRFYYSVVRKKIIKFLKK